MKKSIGFIAASVVLSVFLLFPIAAEAIPGLGAFPTHGGIYYGPMQDWLPVITDTALGTGEGFAFPDDGEITVWYGSDDGSLDLNVNIYLATTASGTFTYDWTGGPENLSPKAGHDQADGYFRIGGTAYNQVLLPAVSTANGWLEASDFPFPDVDPGEINSFLTGGKEFWFLSGTFSPDLPAGEWLFAWADFPTDQVFNNVFNDGVDKFSPKTTSTVPEPATLLLLGTGLAMLWLFGRRKSRAVR